MLRLLSLCLILLTGLVYADTTEVSIPGYTPPGTPVPAATAAPAAVEVAAPAAATATSTTTTTTKVETDEEKAKKAWKLYLGKLSKCTPGTYVLKQINPDLQAQYGDVETSKIIGPLGEKCHVTIMYYAESDARLTAVSTTPDTSKYPAGQDCYFTNSTLDSLVQYSSDVVKGQSAELSTEDPLANAMSGQCTPYVVMNGQIVK